MRRLLALAALALAGCYAPSPPDGAYLCATGDQACPSGQHCTCGQCVKHDSAAACSFTVSTSAPDGQKLDVTEHQQFALTVQALDQNGAPATGFNGTVQLSSNWGDVQPPTLPLQGGTAQGMVSLNRETLPPAVATVTASFAGNRGTSGGINVNLPPFTVAQMEILPPVTKFGWATSLAAEPAIVKEGSLYKMYFVGQGGGKFGIGLANSVDGINYTAMTDPVLQSASNNLIFSPTYFTGSAGDLLAYSQSDGVGLASTTDGLSFTQSNGGLAVLVPSQCSYCAGGVNFPQVIPDPAATVPDGGTPPLVMFFSAFSQGSVAIGRASSPDGTTWTPEPAPLLSSGLSGEQILLSPRVMLDGTVWKMWYSYANLSDLPSCLSGCPTGSTCNFTTGSCTPTDVGDVFFSLCDVKARVQIGYATSADGFFWTKSTNNPALSIDDVPGGPHALLVSSVLPTDGVNASNGMTLWFSPFRRVIDLSDRCLPNGIRRATRP
jgi:hypothetical protein